MEKHANNLQLKKLDLLIIALSALLSLAPLLPLITSSETAASVRIEQHGELLYEGSLDENTEITTPDGKNTVGIQDGSARMLHADCADGLCLAAGNATAMRPIVCLPNEVTVTIITEKEAEYDALTQ